MKISDILVGKKNINIEAEIIEISPVKEFSKFGRTGRVATAIITDGSGKIMMTLWDEQVNMVKAGDKIRISNAYVKEWQGEKQLNTGRNGSLELIGSYLNQNI